VPFLGVSSATGTWPVAPGSLISAYGVNLCKDPRLLPSLLPVFLPCLLLPPASAQQFLQQGNKLVGADAVGPTLQGDSVALSGDGNTAIVGGYRDNGDVGAAWIYSRTGPGRA
jgi:hypothetical protein